MSDEQSPSYRILYQRTGSRSDYQKDYEYHGLKYQTCALVPAELEILESIVLITAWGIGKNSSVNMGLSL